MTPLSHPFLLLLLLVGAAHSSPYRAHRFKKNSQEGPTYWNNVAQQELERALGVKVNTHKAKNVILFLGDGMSIPTLTAARIYKGQQSGQGGEEGKLAFEDFPHLGLSKTYNTDRQVSDSASTATAYLTGVKANYKTLGVDSSVLYGNCTTINSNNKLDSVIKWAQDAGMKTGLVTTTRVTHATPAASYAHVADRNWECDGGISDDDLVNCPDVLDIARQLVEEEPGASINVVMGGGYAGLNADAVSTPDDPFDEEWGCQRKDGRNLTHTWSERKTAQGVEWAFVRTESQLQSLDLANTEYLLGVFANDHLPYDYHRRAAQLDVPSLSLMTEAAIKVLAGGDQGFFLLVEGGRIDHAHHDSVAHRALDETIAFNQAVEKALALTEEQDTLVVVTADHSHTMSISGYPLRGQEIIGLAAIGDDGLPYTTLMYANGPGFNYTVEEDGVSRPNVTNDEAVSWDYTQQSVVPRSQETHGGDDVAIYARGPMAHLFHSLHEQNYIAHVMAAAACIGQYTGADCPSGAVQLAPSIVLAALVLALLTHTRHFH